MTSQHARVWFNQSLSNVYDVIRIVRDADTDRELTLLNSHVNDYSPGLSIADESWLEPAGLSNEDYIAWCLDVCRLNQVDLLVPSRRREVIAAFQPKFEAAGTRVMSTGSPKVLQLLEEKGDFYRDLQETDILLPEYRVAKSLADFDQAYSEMSSRHKYLCVKPCVGMFGEGFHVLQPHIDKLEMLESPVSCSLSNYRSSLVSTKKIRPMLLMQYLDGDERSIDCVALNGQLVSAVSRRKLKNYQVLETDGAAIEMAGKLCSRYRLNGIFNVQTKDHEGVPHLLEINSRMSGGLLYACHSGVALPYWAIRLQLGWSDAYAVPLPVPGLKVAPVQGSVVLKCGN